ncbi:MAG TPA: RagB/SusD family nutrient uptake outer membrane protein [Puia sp.]|jgi:hypothetical protein|nr:RagB/SusD family nutrient uptake outer membrane protein [Puia sp.]
MKPISILSGACLLLFLLVLPSCKKFIEVPSPGNQLNITNVFTDDKTATAAVIGIYSDMEFSAPISMYLTVLPGLSADEFTYTSGDKGFSEFASNTYMPNNAYAASFWGIYSNVYEANSCIQGIQASTRLSPGTSNQLLGEARFSRAFCYFYLVNFFGDVPLALSTDYRINDTLHRAPISQVFQQITTDLVAAKSLLSAAYPTDERVRPNKWTASALLSRVYLYTHRWADAEAEASSIINSGLYTMSPLESVFLNTSNETIWQLMPVNPTFNTQEGAIFIPGLTSQIPTYPLSGSFVNAFESGDNRMSAWTGSTVVGSQIFYYPRKYKIPGGGTESEDHIMFRLAEQYLIRAEARKQQGNITDAMEDINTIRSRAGLGVLSVSLSPDQVDDALLQERRIELFAELGHRWLDLKRTNRVDAIIGTLKPSTWKPTAALWPVPQSQRSADPFLTQNEGY